MDDIDRIKCEKLIAMMRNEIAIAERENALGGWIYDHAEQVVAFSSEIDAILAKY